MSPEIADFSSPKSALSWPPSVAEGSLDASWSASLAPACASGSAATRPAARCDGLPGFPRFSPNCVSWRGAYPPCTALGKCPPHPAARRRRTPTSGALSQIDLLFFISSLTDYTDRRISAQSAPPPAVRGARGRASRTRSRIRGPAEGDGFAVAAVLAAIDSTMSGRAARARPPRVSNSPTPSRSSVWNGSSAETRPVARNLS